MSCTMVHLGIGTRVVVDGEICEIAEFLQRTTGAEVVLAGATSAHRMTLAALLTSDRAKLLPDETPLTNGESK